MGKQPESKLSYKIIKAIKDRGGYAYKNHGNEYMPSGLPDITGVYRGYFIFIETKTPDNGNKPSLIQEYRMGLLRKAGGIGGVGKTVKEAMGYLDLVDAHCEQIERFLDGEG